jgi:DNA-binding PadR family transcriptional regulator
MKEDKTSKEDNKKPYSDLFTLVLDKFSDDQPHSPGDIAKEIEVKKQVVNYWFNKLKKANLIIISARTKKAFYVITDDGRRFLSDSKNINAGSIVSHENGKNSKDDFYLHSVEVKIRVKEWDKGILQKFNDNPINLGRYFGVKEKVGNIDIYCKPKSNTITYFMPVFAKNPREIDFIAGQKQVIVKEFLMKQFPGLILYPAEFTKRKIHLSLPDYVKPDSLTKVPDFQVRLTKFVTMTGDDSPEGDTNKPRYDKKDIELKGDYESVIKAGTDILNGYRIAGEDIKEDMKEMKQFNQIMVAEMKGLTLTLASFTHSFNEFIRTIKENMEK